jgi:hypothetical protein
MPTGPLKDRPSIEKNSNHKTKAIAAGFDENGLGIASSAWPIW